MLSVFCLFLGLVAAVSGECQEPFQPVGEGCYYFSYKDNLERSGWASAREYCQSLGSGVDLAVLDYLCDDYHHIANYLLGEDVHETLPTMYIGADGYGASWLWVDGRALSPNSIYWWESEPGSSSSHCLCLYPTKPHSYRKIFISEFSCISTYHFVCQDNVHARR